MIDAPRNVFRRALADVLVHEGGWSDHPDDPGGKTFRGVTKKAWEAHVGRKVSGEELKRLTFDQIAEFYYRRYWLVAECDQLPHGISALVFDIAVNSGPSRAIKILQHAMNKLTRTRLLVDGIAGPKTIATAARVNVFECIDEMAIERLRFFQRLKTWGSFGNGWTRRAFKTATFATQEACGLGGAVITQTMDYDPPLKVSR